MEEICAQAIKLAGGPAKMASALVEAGNKPITSQAVSQWTKVPADRVIAVEGICGLSRHDLRPDIFGPAPAAGVAA